MTLAGRATPTRLPRIGVADVALSSYPPRRFGAIENFSSRIALSVEALFANVREVAPAAESGKALSDSQAYATAAPRLAKPDNVHVSG